MNRLVLGTILALSAVLIAVASVGIGSPGIPDDDIKKQTLRKFDQNASLVTPSPTTPTIEVTPNQSIPPPEDKKSFL